MTNNWEIKCGDALDLIRTTRGVRGVITDPPYMLSTASKMNGAKGAKLDSWPDAMNGAYWFAKWMQEVKDILPPNGFLVTMLNWRSVATYQRALSMCDWEPASLVIWDKGWIGTCGPSQYRPTYEMAFLVPMPGFTLPDRSLPDIKAVKWSSNKPHGHPAEKPVELMRKFVAECSEPGDLILDPFCGSGTTGEACLIEGRRFIGIEQNEKWAEMATQRLQEVDNPILALAIEARQQELGDA